MQTALLSAFHKGKPLAGFARGLVELEWNILASAGTKKFLDEHKIPSTDIGDIVGEPILGHRVVTLDRRIYAAILARRSVPEDMQELKRLNVAPISLVYVDLYPLAEELTKPDCSYHSVLEKVDIGGPTLLRAAAKGNCYVLSGENQFEGVLNFIKNPPDPSTPRGIVIGNRFVAQLAAEAEHKVALYAALAATFYKSVAEGDFPHKWRQSAA